MELTRAEVDRMLQHADELRTKLRRASRELKEFGEEVMAAREEARTRDASSSPSPPLPAERRRPGG